MNKTKNIDITIEGEVYKPLEDCNGCVILRNKLFIQYLDITFIYSLN